MLNRTFAGFHGLLMGGSEAVYCRKIHKNQSLDCSKGGAGHDHLSMLFRIFAVYIKLDLIMRLAFLLVVLIATSSYAEEPLDLCTEAARNSPEVYACLGQESERLDQRLKIAIDEKLRGLTYSREFENDGWSQEGLASLRRNLRQSQIEWKKYRNAWCHYRADTMNGSGSAGMFSTCMIDMTKERLSAVASW